jgi:hypothetical protein
MLSLQNALEAACVAVSAYLMTWFGKLRGRFQDISERATFPTMKFIFLLLTLPAFKISNLFFEIAYSVQKRRMLRLGAHCATLGGENYGIQFDDLRLDKLTIAQRHCRLDEIANNLGRRS